MLRAVCLFLILPVSTTSLADISQSDYDTCQKLTDSLIRLRCYDTLKSIEIEQKSAPTVATSTVIIPVVSATPSVPEVSVPNLPSITNKSTAGITEYQRELLTSLSTGKWQVTKKVLNSGDELKNTATATLVANSDVTNTGFLPLLTAHCNGTKTKVFINWGESIDKIKQVEILIGGEKFYSKRWNLSKNKNISFYPKFPPYFLKQMSHKNKFEISLLLRNGETKFAIFDTSHMTQAIEPIRAACEW